MVFYRIVDRQVLVAQAIVRPGAPRHGAQTLQPFVMMPPVTLRAAFAVPML